MEMNAKIEIDNDALTSLAQNIVEEMLHDKVENEVEEQLDDKIGEKIESYLRYDFDIEEHLRNVDLNDYIEMPDVTDHIHTLLEDFNPATACETGRAFMEAVQRIIGHFNIVLVDENKQFFKVIVEEVVAELLKDSLKTAIRQELADGIVGNLRREVAAKISTSFQQLIHQP